MLRNFSNGVFAMGIFAGVVFCILLNPIVNFFGWELSIWSNETLQGVLVGGGITLLAAYWPFHLQSKTKAKRVATAVQIKLFQNFNSAASIKWSIKNAKSRVENKGASDLHYLGGLIPPAINRRSHHASAEELALVMELLRPDQKEGFMEIWMRYDNLEKLFDEFLFARQSAVDEAGLPQSLLFLAGTHSIDVADLTLLNSKLDVLAPFVGGCLSQCEDVLDRTAKLLHTLQTQLTEKAGIKTDFVSIETKPNS
ncbi:hypothetical protein EOK75_10960 [Pseudorhodobacter turbinis]|uniref:Uncharacterized protein n=1 Tax=Pseudorhodobacter turbinis TaxID=2500533 RepID=A0A4P8EGC3_9RHOB|nr:hypothetical protein [Pseudorhodobacter turbinis]QCO56201.1 hypothetical protein EOK75_10960 [Pseudorhodobacter turbinis]